MLGKLTLSKNLDRKFAASSSYYRVLVVTDRDELETLLFTPAEIARARVRRKKNPEDEILSGRFHRLLFWILRVLTYR